MAKAASIPSFISGFRLFLGENLQTLADALSGGLAVPSTFQAQAGSSTASFGDTGNLSVQFPTSSLPGNGADTTDDVLFTYALGPNSFDKAGRQVTATAAGHFAANGNNKRIQIYVGTDVQTVGSAIVTTATTSVASSGTVTQNAGGWNATLLLTSQGASAQKAVNMGIQLTGSHLGTTAPTALTYSGASTIYITLTGASQTSGAANDVVADGFDIAFNN